MDTNFKAKLARINQAKAEVDSLRPLKPDQEARIFQKFRLDWNYHSNAIEGNKLTIGETELFLSEGLTASGKPFKDHLDIKGHDEVIGFLKSFVAKNEELTEAIIRQMHKVMLVEPYHTEARTSDGRIVQKLVEIGQYKSEPNEVVTTVGAIHTYVLPQDVPAKMAELILWYRNNVASEHPVFVAATLHHTFTAIHPFADGNGRMARLLSNLILMRAGFPPVVIKTGERDRYVAGLVNADHGDVSSFFDFFADKVLDSLNLYLKGAHGESLDEEDDIDKKIALFKQQLSSEPEPIAYSEGVYQKSVDQNIAFFLRKLFSKLSKFDDLFLENTVMLSEGGGLTHIPPSPSIVEDLLAKLKKKPAPQPRTRILHLGWQDFKKAGGKTFNYSQQINLNFTKLTYGIEFGDLKIERLYSDRIEEHEAISIVNKVAERFLNAIQNFYTTTGRQASSQNATEKN